MFMNSNFFEPGKSKSERSFIQTTVKNNSRIDGRKINEFRDVQLNFGSEWGTVAVILGQTQVVANVSCDMTTPSGGRPNEGTIHLNICINGVAFLHESQATHEERVLTLNSLLERTFRNSRCLDLESLCVAAEQHVWGIRVDVTVLNHDGNLYDASTIATLAALMHFRRPEVSYDDEKLRTYTSKEREMVPLLFLHYPVSVTYCVYRSTTQPVVDPTLLEENAADSIIVLGLNSYSELCTLNAGGTVPTSAPVIMQCARSAARRCKEMVKFLRKAIAIDEEQRQAKNLVVLNWLSKSTESKLTFNSIMAGNGRKSSKLDSKSDSLNAAENAAKLPVPEPDKQTKVPSNRKSAAPKDESLWLPADTEQVESEIKNLVIKDSHKSKAKTHKKRGKGESGPKQNQSDSEEEAKPVLAQQFLH